MKRVKITIAFILSLLIVGAFGSLKVSADEIQMIDIQVDLQENGDGLVNERWEVYNTGGTEWYKPMENFADGQSLEDFQVFINGQAMAYEPNWDIDGSFEEKAGTYGTYQNELNWGKTAMGEVTYDVSYRISPLVLETEDNYQMIYWQFMNPRMDPAPDSFRLTIDNQVEPMTEEDYRIWGFGMEGPVQFEEGQIRAHNTGQLSSSSYMVLLVQIPPGTFTDPVSVSGTFAEWRDRAFEGSDYGEDSGPGIVGLIIGAVGVGIAVLATWFAYKSSEGYKKKHIKKAYPTMKEESKRLEGEYFRQPVFDEVFETFALNRTLLYAQNSDSFFDNYLTAGILELVRLGVVEVRSVNGKDEFHLRERDPKLPYHLQKIYQLMEKGTSRKTDKIDLDLATKRFFRDGRDNTEKLFKEYEKNLIKDQKAQGLLADLSFSNPQDKDAKKAHEALGFALTDSGKAKREDMVRNFNFLKDFTLLDERGAFEVELWDELMLYASVYGITEQVAKQLEEIYPDYWEKSDYTTYSPTVRPYTIFYLSRSAPRRVRTHNNTLKQQRQRSSGRGGGMSMGGGGGSFGGGMGGGSR